MKAAAQTALDEVDAVLTVAGRAEPSSPPVCSSASLSAMQAPAAAQAVAIDGGEQAGVDLADLSPGAGGGNKSLLCVTSTPMPFAIVDDTRVSPSLVKSGRSSRAAYDTAASDSMTNNLVGLVDGTLRRLRNDHTNSYDTGTGEATLSPEFCGVVDRVYYGTDPDTGADSSVRLVLVQKVVPALPRDVLARAQLLQVHGADLSHGVLEFDSGVRIQLHEHANKTVHLSYAPSNGVVAKSMLPLGFSNTNVGMPAVRLTEIQRLLYEHCRGGHKALTDVLEACKVRGLTFSKEAIRAVSLIGCKACNLARQRHTPIKHNEKLTLLLKRAQIEGSVTVVVFDQLGPVAVESAEYKYRHAILYWAPKYGFSFVLGTKRITEQDIEKCCQLLRASLRFQLGEIGTFKVDGLITTSLKSQNWVSYLNDSLLGQKSTPPYRHSYLDVEQHVGRIVPAAVAAMIQGDGSGVRTPRDQWFNALALQCVANNLMPNRMAVVAG